MSSKSRRAAALRRRSFHGKQLFGAKGDAQATAGAGGGIGGDALRALRNGIVQAGADTPRAAVGTGSATGSGQFHTQQALRQLLKGGKGGKRFPSKLINACIAFFLQPFLQLAECFGMP